MSKKIGTQNMIFLNDAKIKKQMEEYANRHKLEAQENYGYEDDFMVNIAEKRTLAETIHNKYDGMSMDEMRNTVASCMSDKHVKRTLLNFELKYSIITPVFKKLSIEQFTKEALQILKKYQCKAGGYYIEDRDWTVHTQTSDEYEVKNYQIVLENSADKRNCQDNETINYLKNIVRLLNGLSNDIKVEYEIDEPEKGNIVWILIWCTHKGMKKNEPEISL
uniref:Uncharacterized protein n=1 Tax=Mimivirus LCMiAC01 TaxID=2506608 RepID=A0A481Z1B7_9VIRU|nr:MAG: hypothetical protein LCMiAC01_01630 [Mimivirus LCMiAC01]